MTDKELKDISNIALIRKLEWCGHDGYYNDIYYPILKEIKRRLCRSDQNDQNPDLNEIKEQALTCSAELLKLVALIGRYAREDEP